jgi:signal transduction histidine kinase
VTAPTAPRPHFAGQPSLKRLKIATIAMVIITPVAMVIGATLYLSIQYDNIILRALSRTLTITKTIGSQAEQTFSETFRVLEGIGDVYIHEREHNDLNVKLLHELLAEKLKRIPEVMTFVILDENQQGVAAARTYPLAPDFDRPERKRRLPPLIFTGGFGIGDIYQNTRPELTVGAWLLPIILNVSAHDGADLGQIIAVVDVASFSAFYNTLDVAAHGQIALWSANGILTAANASIDSEIGEFNQEALDHLDTLHNQPNRTTESIDPWVEGEITVRRMLANAPLYVSVKHDAQDFLAGWRSGRNTIIVAVPSLAFAMIGFAFIIFLQLKRAENNEADLRQAKAAAEDANEAKGRFLAHMSHEFRTPLNAIMGFSEIIKNKVLGGDVATPYVSYADHIHRSGEHLLNIVNDILDMAKVESGVQALQQQAIDMRAAAASAVSYIEGVAAQKNVQILIDPFESVPRVIGDERFVRQVLINLLSNAVKFSPEGEKVRVTASHKTGQPLDISVTDNGPGVDPSILRRLGEPFLQGDPAISQSGQGTGLGLSICKRYMDLLGGELVLERATDRGTTATIRFPPNLLNYSAP